MNFELSEEQRLLQENIFEAARKMPHDADFNQKWKYVADTGIIGTVIDADYGGLGLGAIDMLIALEALGKGSVDNGLSFAIAAHTLACVVPIHKYGSVAQKDKYLSALMNGSMIAANAMTESESGSDVFNLQCKAIKENDDYVLTGNKTFISNSAVSSVVLTYVATNPDKGFFGGLTSFIIDRKDYKIGQTFEKMGLENCSLGEIIFDGSRLSADAILGKEGGGAFIFNHSMEWERICLAGIHLGAMQRVMTKTIEFVKQRKSLGQSIGKFQGVSHAIADMQVALEVAQQYAYKSAWLLDHRKNISKEAAITKLFVSNSVKQFMLQALQIFGGYGYITEYGIEQEVRDSLSATIYSGTSEIQKNIIASNLGI